MCAGVKPSKAASEEFDFQAMLVQEGLIDGRDLQLSAGRWLDVACHFDYFVGIEVEANHGVVRLGMLGLFFNREYVALSVERRYAVPLGVVDVITEYGCVLFVSCVENGAF